MILNVDAWITFAVDEITYKAAWNLGQSLRNLLTKKKLIIFIPDGFENNFV